jgi:hypothetical protein
MPFHPRTCTGRGDSSQFDRGVPKWPPASRGQGSAIGATRQEHMERHGLHLREAIQLELHSVAGHA